MAPGTRHLKVEGYLIGGREANKLPLPPKVEYQWWYQYYFATDRGALGYEKYRNDFGKLIWRISVAKGDPKYDALENKLAAGPVIAVPTITLEGDANGAPHADGDVYRKKFSGKYEHRIVSGGIGHNLPQEAPQAFAQAVVDVDRL
jgi:pimeloyl-ACP methyl ester carboxylesterase